MITNLSDNDSDEDNAGIPLPSPLQGAPPQALGGGGGLSWVVRPDLIGRVFIPGVVTCGALYPGFRQAAEQIDNLYAKRAQAASKACGTGDCSSRYTASIGPNSFTADVFLLSILKGLLDNGHEAECRALLELLRATFARVIPTFLALFDENNKSPDATLIRESFRDFGRWLTVGAFTSDDDLIRFLRHVWGFHYLACPTIPWGSSARTGTATLLGFRKHNEWTLQVTRIAASALLKSESDQIIYAPLRPFLNIGVIPPYNNSNLVPSPPQLFDYMARLDACRRCINLEFEVVKSFLDGGSTRDGYLSEVDSIFGALLSDGLTYMAGVLESDAPSGFRNRHPIKLDSRALAYHLHGSQSKAALRLVELCGGDLAALDTCGPHFCTLNRVMGTDPLCRLSSLNEAREHILAILSRSGGALNAATIADVDKALDAAAVDLMSSQPAGSRVNSRADLRAQAERGRIAARVARVHAAIRVCTNHRAVYGHL